MTIHRNTTYIKFRAAVETNGSRAGAIMEAWRADPADYWKIYVPEEGKRYQATAGIIRAISGEVIEQDNRPLSLDWRLRH